MWKGGEWKDAIGSPAAFSQLAQKKLELDRQRRAIVYGPDPDVEPDGPPPDGSFGMANLTTPGLIEYATRPLVQDFKNAQQAKERQKQRDEEVRKSLLFRIREAALDKKDLESIYWAWDAENQGQQGYDPSGVGLNYRVAESYYKQIAADVARVEPKALETYQELVNYRNGKSGSNIAAGRHLAPLSLPDQDLGIEIIIRKAGALGEKLPVNFREPQALGEALWRGWENLDYGGKIGRLRMAVTTTAFKAGDYVTEGNPIRQVNSDIENAANLLYHAKKRFKGYPLTPEKADDWNRQLDNFVAVLDLTERLRKVGQDYVDPHRVGIAAFQKTVIPVAESAALLISASHPLGWASTVDLATLSYQNDNYMRYRAEGRSVKEASTMGLASAFGQVALDRLEASVLMKGVPNLTRSLERLSLRGSEVIRAAVNTGKITIAETSIEIGQDIVIPALVQDIMTSNPKFDKKWVGVWMEAIEAAPDIALGMVLLAGIGGTAHARGQTRYIAELSANRGAMRISGYSVEQIAEIQAAPLEQRGDLLARYLPEKAPEGEELKRAVKEAIALGREDQAALQATHHAETAGAIEASDYGVNITRTDGGYEISQPDGGSITIGDAPTAREFRDELKSEGAQDEAQRLGEITNDWNNGSDESSHNAAPAEAAASVPAGAGSEATAGATASSGKATAIAGGQSSSVAPAANGGLANGASPGLNAASGDGGAMVPNAVPIVHGASMGGAVPAANAATGNTAAASNQVAAGISTPAAGTASTGAAGLTGNASLAGSGDQSNGSAAVGTPGPVSPSGPAGQAAPASNAATSNEATTPVSTTQAAINTAPANGTTAPASSGTIANNDSQTSSASVGPAASANAQTQRIERAREQSRREANATGNGKIDAAVHGRSWLGKLAHATRELVRRLDARGSQGSVTAFLNESAAADLRRGLQSGAITQAEAQRSLASLTNTLANHPAQSAGEQTLRDRLNEALRDGTNEADFHAAVAELAVAEVMGQTRDGSAVRAGSITAALDTAMRQTTNPAQLRELGKLRAYLRSQRTYFRTLFDTLSAVKESRRTGGIEAFDSTFENLFGDWDSTSHDPVDAQWPDDQNPDSNAVYAPAGKSSPPKIFADPVATYDWKTPPDSVDIIIETMERDLAPLMQKIAEVKAKLERPKGSPPLTRAEFDARAPLRDALRTLESEARVRGRAIVEVPISQRTKKMEDAIKAPIPSSIAKAVRAGWSIAAAYTLPSLLPAIGRVIHLPITETSCYFEGDIYLRGDAYDSTAAHEITHGAESQNAAVLAACLAFRDSRTKGEQPRMLSELTGDKTYKEDAVAYVDRWEELGGDVYTGREYKDNIGTEILSTGIERLHRDPMLFLRTDPEFFSFVVNTLRGW